MCPDENKQQPDALLSQRMEKMGADISEGFEAQGQYNNKPNHHSGNQYSVHSISMLNPINGI
jgi:hypothetical protein